MTTSIVSTNSLKFFVGSTPVAISCQVDATLTITNATRSIECKDSGGGQFTEALYGQTSWAISGSGLLSYDGTFSVSELTGLALARTISPVVLGTGTSGDQKLSGSVIWTQIEIGSAGVNGNCTVSYTATGTGTLTDATYA